MVTNDSVPSSIHRPLLAHFVLSDGQCGAEHAELSALLGMCGVAPPPPPPTAGHHEALLPFDAPLEAADEGGRTAFQRCHFLSL
jgi:hypothetical protein